ATDAPALSTLSLHDALPISPVPDKITPDIFLYNCIYLLVRKDPILWPNKKSGNSGYCFWVFSLIICISSTTFSNPFESAKNPQRSEEHTSELQSRFDLVCRL